MPVVKNRKIIKVGDSHAITLPPDWTGLKQEKLKLIADKLCLIVPMKIKREEAEKLIPILLEAIE